MAESVDFLPSFITDPYVFGMVLMRWKTLYSHYRKQVSANHALSDLHAMAAEPVSAMVSALSERFPPDFPPKFESLFIYRPSQ